MCFGGKNEISDDPPPRPAQNYQSSNSYSNNNNNGNENKMSNFGSNNPYSNRPGQNNQHGNAGGSAASYYDSVGQQQYAPPPGPPAHNQQPPPPPQQQRQDEYAPPPGPPPSHNQQQRQDEYAPPTGPPPSHRPQQQQDEYAPPPGPPPSHSNNTSWIAPPQDGPSQQPPQHNWQAAVPDTSLFPPPPAIFSGYDRSPAHNSTEAEAEAGEEWCRQYPLTEPIRLDGAGADALRNHNFRLIEPMGFNGRLAWQGPGVWDVTTNRDALDRTLISYPPLYVVSQHDPTHTGRTKTVYYEVKISRGSPSVNIAMGFSALPYPGFRLPGWHRASLAVHGDDGHKYINDRWGGKDFTNEFRQGETYGIGLKISPSREAAHRSRVQIFFTRNGVETGGWNLHEETDAEEDLPVTGLEGFHDLCASIGTFEGTEFEVVFNPARWMYQGIEKEYYFVGGPTNAAFSVLSRAAGRHLATVFSNALLKISLACPFHRQTSSPSHTRPDTHFARAAQYGHAIMDVDGDNDLLVKIAAGETLELDAWPALQIDILARLEKIAHTEFAIPNLPPPRELRRSLDNGEPSSSSPLPEPSSQEADKENAPAPAAAAAAADGEAKDDKKAAADEQGDEKAKETEETTGADSDTVMEKADETEVKSAEKAGGDTLSTQQADAQADAAAGNGSDPIELDDDSASTPKLPIQLAAMLGDIKSHLQTFNKAPPHTLQRLAELILNPRAHYRALATYLHAVDRVVQVTSGISTYPLPPAIPDMSSMHINGVDKDSASSVSWGNPANTSSSSAAAAVGSDEALGGALLTPIPWLTRRSSPENGDAASSSSGGGSTSGRGAQIHSEGTETIDGPNGMGSIETVSVSVNGVPSTGHARGVTQGELLRQEQRAGVVPVSQLSRSGGHQQHALQHQQQQQQHQHQLQSQHGAHGDGSDDEDGEDEPRPMDEDTKGDGNNDDGEEEIPHARGPDEIGVNDTGLQTATTSSMGDGGLEMQGIDVAAAVGRPPEEEEHPEQPQKQPAAEAGEEEEGEAADKDKEAAEAAAAASPESTATKREAEDEAEGETLKKVKEE